MIYTMRFKKKKIKSNKLTPTIRIKGNDWFLKIFFNYQFKLFEHSRNILLEFNWKQPQIFCEMINEHNIIAKTVK